jgi:hypothetical protein
MEGVMLVVFLSAGYVVRGVIRYTPDSPILFVVGLAVVTILVEVIHEGLHKLVFRALGVSASIEWSQLAVIPYNQEVSIPRVLAALVAPGVLVSTGLLGLMALDVSPVITAISGFGIVLNMTVSVVDVFSAFKLIGEPLDSRIYFESTSAGTRIHLTSSHG